MKGFETNQHAREFWQALKNSVVPLKFAYTGSAAFTHNVLAKQASYKQVAGETAIEIEAVMQSIAPKRTSLEVCDIGPGNAMHSILFLSELQDRDLVLTRYLALDFSATLLGIAREAIAENLPALEFHSSIWDFEKSSTEAIRNWRSSTNALVTLTGHSLGNAQLPERVLSNIGASCDPGDMLVLGVALMAVDAVKDDIVGDYENDIFKSAALEPLRMAGVPVEQGRLSLTFSDAEQAVVGDFVSGAHTNLQFEDDAITITPGDKIRCFISRRFQDEVVRGLLRETRWGLQSARYSANRSHGVYACLWGSL